MGWTSASSFQLTADPSREACVSPTQSAIPSYILVSQRSSNPPREASPCILLSLAFVLCLSSSTWPENDRWRPQLHPGGFGAPPMQLPPLRVFRLPERMQNPKSRLQPLTIALQQAAWPIIYVSYKP